MKPTSPINPDRDDLGFVLRMAFGPGYQVAVDPAKTLEAVRKRPLFHQ